MYVHPSIFESLLVQLPIPPRSNVHCTAPCDTYIEIAVSVRECLGSLVKTLVTKVTCSVSRGGLATLLATLHAAELPVSVVK